MHLSSSAIMSSGYLSKAQVNNFVDYTPPKSNFRTSTEISPDLLARSSLQFGITGQKYSPELESLRRDFNDQLRNLFYTLTGDVNTLKKNNSENKTQIDELRRELDIANSKILQNKNANVSELNFIKETVLSNKGDAKVFQLDETVRGSWTRHDVKAHDYSSDISNINDRMAQISRQINSVNEELEAVKKASYVPKDQFNKTMGDFIDELERKLSIINERVRERIEEMDNNLVTSLKDKEQDFNKLYYDIRSVQSSMIRVSDQVNTFTHSADVNLEGQVKKIIHGYHIELKNLSSMASNLEMKAKMIKKDESMMLGSGLQQYQHRETDSKFKELDTIYQSIVLLEKEMRSKVDMVDLNVNSIKRNLELELSIQLKNMMLPLQNNIEQYLLSSENRFVALEDAVLNHMKRESYVMPPERTSKLRGTMDFRDSPFIEDQQTHYTNKNGFENISNIEPHRQPKSEKKATTNNRKLSHGSETKEKGREKEKEKEKEKPFSEAFRVDEADSVISVSQTVQSHNLKTEGRYNQPDEKSFEDPSYHAESPHDLSHDVVQEDDEDPEVEVGELEDETPAVNVAKKISSDQDRNKKQRNAEKAFKNLEPLSQPDTMYRDFPSASAFKSHLEEHHPGNRDRPSSSKKKKPEIELNDNANKGAVKETSKKSSSKTSPLNIDSRLALGSEDFSNEDEPSPVVKKPSIDMKEKKPLERGRDAPEMLGDTINEDFKGGVKGLLSKARNKRESTPTLEEEDYRPSRGKSAPKGKYEEDIRGSYGYEQPVEDRFRRNLPLPNKSLERANSRDSVNKVQQKPALPPVDTKNMKNFNKSAGLKPPQGKNGSLQNRQQNNLRGGNPRAMQNVDEEEDVEEIVYHVDEEGFLIDEQGNYLVDEQGNFLQLSPEQLREIEDNDLVYEKEY